MERSPYQKPEGEEGAVRRMGEQAREKAQQLGSRAAEQARSTAESAKHRAESMAEEERSRLAGRIEGVARALKRTGTEMHDEDDQLSNMADKLGSQVEKLSGWLREHDTRDMLGRVEDFARKQPAIFLGGAFLVGVAAARFLKSSSSRRTDVGGPELEGPGRYQYGSSEHIVPQPTIPVTSQTSPAPGYGRAEAARVGQPGSTQSSAGKTGPAGGSTQQSAGQKPSEQGTQPSTPGTPSTTPRWRP